MKKYANTVLGPIDPGELGITLLHEHVLIDAIPGWWQEPSEPKARAWANKPVTIEKLGYLRHNPLGIRDNLIIDDVGIATKELDLFIKAGGQTIVDLSIVGLYDQRQRVEGLVEISQNTGVNIICGTGFYLHKSLEQIIKDIDSGIAESNVKAGIIGEVGTSFPITSFEEKSLIASAQAQAETGASITIHVAPEGREGLKIVEILKNAGADLTRVILDHMDERLDLDYHYVLGDYGVVLAYDTFGAEWYYSTVNISEPFDKERVDGVVQLIKKGYISQIILSHDVWLKQCLSSYGGMGYAHILQHIVPMLKHRGVSDKQINQMLIENPRKLLQFSENDRND